MQAESMNLSSEDQSSLDIVQDYSGLVGLFSGDIGGCSGYLNSGSMPAVSQSLVLDNERRELVKTSGRLGKKGEGSEAKSAAALKSHSEAERRRRERINAHLAALRGLVPSNEKMDKAKLLAEVINQVKQLKKTATQVSDSFFFPLDSDEVKVEQIDDTTGEGTSSFRASLCCEYRPGLLSDMRQALDALHLNLVRSEISTLGGRVKNVFFFTASKIRDTGNATETRARIMNSVHQALTAIVDKAAASAECSPRTMFPSKRQRVSYFESSSSSS